MSERRRTMLKRLSGLVLTVLLLVSFSSGLGCGSPSVVAKPTPPCWVPPWPVYPDLVLLPCSDGATCLAKDSAVDLALWVGAAVAYHDAVLACPGVEN